MYVAREVVVENDPEKLDEALAVYRSRVDELEKVGCVASYLLRDRSEARLTWLPVWEEGSADARGEQTQKRVDIARQVAEVLGGVRQTGGITLARTPAGLSTDKATYCGQVSAP
jgi:hypothetical protein